jgi:protein involved in polysaccharide export with SLBB domain
MATPSAATVHVGGDVRRPGAYAWFPGMTVRRLVAAAGGLTPKADGGREIVREGTTGTESERTSRTRRETASSPVGPLRQTQWTIGLLPARRGRLFQAVEVLAPQRRRSRPPASTRRSSRNR